MDDFFQACYSFQNAIKSLKAAVFTFCLYKILSYLKGSNILQAVLVASRKSLIERKGTLDMTHEILERLEAHLRAIGQFTVCHVS